MRPKDILLFALLIFSYAAQAQDTLYIYSGGKVVITRSVSEIDSIVYLPCDTTVTDIDGNIYSTVTIGTQTWMASNLRTTKYNDNTIIPNVSDSATWGNLTGPGVCAYFNISDTATINLIGRLYNWYTINTGKLAPKGWHVPSDAEFITLITYLGGVEVASGKLAKSASWKSPTFEATNESGFSAVPGGCRIMSGTFYGIGEVGSWWTSNADCSGYIMNYNESGPNREILNRNFGLSVRCIKDY